MEIRHDRVDDPESKTRIDEERAVALERTEAAGARRRLERADTGRSDGDDTAAASSALLHRGASLGRHSQPFRMQLVILDALGAHGRERTGADVQRQKGSLYALRLERGEQRVVEMQTRRRRGDRPTGSREHGLIALAVA